MGLTAVTERAHRLEDRLGELRSAGLVPSAAEVDVLLADADALEEATATESVPAVETIDAAAVPEGHGGIQAGSAAPRPSAGQAPHDVRAPDGTRSMVRIRLRDDTVLPAARAVILLR